MIKITVNKMFGFLLIATCLHQPAYSKKVRDIVNNSPYKTISIKNINNPNNIDFKVKSYLSNAKGASRKNSKLAGRAHAAHAAIGQARFSGAIIGSAETTDPTVNNSTALIQCMQRATEISNGTAGSPNQQCAFFSLNIPSGHGSGLQYEAPSVYSRVTTSDNNSRNLGAYDAVAFEGQAIFLPGCSLCRGWGFNSSINVQPGTDGYATGYETDIINYGTVGKINSPNEKQGYSAVCMRGNNCTIGFSLGSDTVARWEYGFSAMTQFMAPGACVFCVLDGSIAGLPAVAAIYADGHTLARQSAMISGESNSSRSIYFLTNDKNNRPVNRWQISANDFSERGENTGSDLTICNFNDDGKKISCPISIERSTGNIVAKGRFLAESGADLGVSHLLATKFSALPSCNEATEGTVAFVIDARSPVTKWHQRVTTGNGKNKSFVGCNGSAWLAL